MRANQREQRQHRWTDRRTGREDTACLSNGSPLWKHLLLMRMRVCNLCSFAGLGAVAVLMSSRRRRIGAQSNFFLAHSLLTPVISELGQTHTHPESSLGPTFHSSWISRQSPGSILETIGQSCAATLPCHSGGTPVAFTNDASHACWDSEENW